MLILINVKLYIKIPKVKVKVINQFSKFNI